MKKWHDFEGRLIVGSYRQNHKKAKLMFIGRTSKKFIPRREDEEPPNNGHYFGAYAFAGILIAAFILIIYDFIRKTNS